MCARHTQARATAPHMDILFAALHFLCCAHAVDQYIAMVAACKADLVGFLIGDLLHSDRLEDRLHANPNKVVDQGVHWLVFATIALSNQHLLATHSHHPYHAVTPSGKSCQTSTDNQTRVNHTLMRLAKPKSAACTHASMPHLPQQLFQHRTDPDHWTMLKGSPGVACLTDSEQCHSTAVHLLFLVD